MTYVGEFSAKVYRTSDKKKLKNTSKTYSYGTVSIRDPKLNKYIGKKVIVKISTKEDNE